MSEEQRTRWRLVLGAASEAELGVGLSSEDARLEGALEWLYDRDLDGVGSDSGPKQAGEGPSALTTPDWINEVHELFPQETIERLEKDAVETYGIAEVVTDPRVLERVEPNPALLGAVLKTKHLMNEQVLSAARRLVQKVVQQLMEELSQEVKSRFAGIVHRQRSRFAPKGGPVDLARTLRHNLKNYDPDRRTILPERIYFHERRERRLDTWQIILLVDQSGSMVDSVIHAAVTAAILHGLPGVKSHLVAFDTSVVDLTNEVADPVKTLMSVQLGGGTYIAKAVKYAASLVRSPRRTAVIIISDFYEGDAPGQLEREVAALCDEGALVLGLAALDRNAQPNYDRDMAARLVKRGAEVGAMTPGELAGWLAEKMRR